MQEINSSSKQVAMDPSATPVKSRWEQREVNWNSIKDAYNAPDVGALKKAYNVAAAILKNVGNYIYNAGLSAAGYLVNLIYPVNQAEVQDDTAVAAPAAAPEAQKAEQTTVIYAQSVQVEIIDGTTAAVEAEKPADVAAPVKAEEKPAVVEDETVPANSYGVDLPDATITDAATVESNDGVEQADKQDEVILAEPQVARSWTKTAAYALAGTAVLGGVVALAYAYRTGNLNNPAQVLADARKAATEAKDAFCKEGMGKTVCDFPGEALTYAATSRPGVFAAHYYNEAWNMFASAPAAAQTAQAAAAQAAQTAAAQAAQTAAAQAAQAAAAQAAQAAAAQAAQTAAAQAAQTAAAQAAQTVAQAAQTVAQAAANV